MINESIRDLFDKWIKEEISFDDEKFMKTFEAKGNVFSACCFYAGFRTAEKLVKIEILEEVLKKLALQDTPVPEHCDFTTYMYGACDNVNESMRMVNEFLTKLKEV